MRALPALALSAALGVSPCVAHAESPGFIDPLQTLALQSPLAATSVMQGVTRAGKRLVAVGQRGHIVFSDDAGGEWKQAEVPLASDLTAVHFPVPQKGWAVGHDGVVLHSGDGGHRWVKQLDGVQAAALALAYYRERAQGGDADMERMLQEAQRLQAEGADKPFLDVWFENERIGYVIGAFNLMLGTTDGGQTWAPWLHRIDNPRGLHLYGIRGAGPDLYIAGEQGLLLRLDPSRQRFKNVATPYKGSYFGTLVKPGLVLAYGLRGNAYRSQDRGRSWSRCDTGVSSGITGATVLDDGGLVLVTQTGQVLVSRDECATFSPVRIKDPAPFHGVAEVRPGVIAITGMRGVRVEAAR